MTNLKERLWTIKQGAAVQDEALTAAQRSALTRLSEEELEVVEQVVDSIADMGTRQELESVLEVLDASFGNTPRLILEKYITFVEEDYQLLRREGGGG
jgi:hypothetical protein